MRERILSNEIEGPLGSMALAIEGLLGQSTELFVREVLMLLHSQVSILSCLLKDIVDLKTLSIGKFEIALEIFDPKQVFSFFEENFRR